MASVHKQSALSWLTIWSTLFTLLAFNVIGTTAADEIRWIKYTGNDGIVWLDDARRPSLYTQNFGDCQGDSLINVTRFDAAYYKDNMTVLFHLEGNSALANEDLMLYIGVFAYGESRFNLTFNPCNANIDSLCPLNSSIPITANGIIPVAPSDVANIPSIALTIPDFEGQAILRIFANSTESQIACFSAVVTNGATFRHTAAVSSVLGLFTAVALLSSFAVTIYGQSIPETRKHYAHSISIFVVFSVYQHIFFTGGLSMNWPSVLVSFWSNYAWSAGIIYNQKMQNSINQFIGGNRGNISMVGAAQSGENAVGLGGGYQISQIYKRTSAILFEPASTFRLPDFEDVLKRRQVANSTGPSWYGAPVYPGLPLPGNYSGFAGTLGQMEIPASNAFLTGLLWFLILIACLIALVVLIKLAIECLSKLRWINSDRLGFFRRHWIWFTGALVLRACYVAFFMMMFLTMFQFTLGGATSVKAIAAVTFVAFLVGMLGVTVYALWYRTKSERLSEESRSAGKAETSIPQPSDDPEQIQKSPSWIQRHLSNLDSGLVHVHDDEIYTTKFGWLASRFRRSRWWFFSAWLLYELVRAAFYGGAAGHPLIQVFGLLAWEIIALVAIVLLKPFESNRLNILMVYLLGFSKVSTVALSSAFDPRFKLARILTTVIGVIIIVIQGLLTICLMIAIALGAISSYMSLTRYHETIKPASWLKNRTRYLAHIDQKATDQPKPPPPPPPPEPEFPKEPYFTVSTVRRQPKISDEDPDDPEDTASTRQSVEPGMGENSVANLPRNSSVRSRPSSSTLPYGARVHRTSWSTRDFQQLDLNTASNAPHSRMSMDSLHDVSMRHRAASLRNTSRDYPDTIVSNVAPVEGNYRGHGRTQSMKYAPKRNSSIVDEEKEADIDAITPR
ncbi:hypothetical protein LTR84_007907 [Exophiala bonariae]|uniref:ML-like domain-containing protein n=1 Tax=Exophiala bonariae TaxID=1690606 RepID=A0AAV9NQH8_9EURO|nr:hypothetical protein LTR84_007907 [Exophiala bonariae]